MVLKKNDHIRLFLVIFILLAVGVFFARSLISTVDPAPPADNQAQSMGRLTAQKTVIQYLQTHQGLPDYYLTKKQAKKHGWDAAIGNLCVVLPGKAIGGDRFINHEKVLPDKQGRIWYEADINYHCGRRGRDRLLYSSDGLIYLTEDHYQHVSRIQR